MSHTEENLTVEEAAAKKKQDRYSFVVGIVIGMVIIGVLTILSLTVH